MNDNEVPEKEDAGPSRNLRIFKGAVKWGTGLCVESVVATAIAALIPAETRAQKIKRMIGAHVIGSMIGELGAEWSWAQIQDIIDHVQKIDTEPEED